MKIRVGLIGVVAILMAMTASGCATLPKPLPGELSPIGDASTFKTWTGIARSGTSEDASYQVLAASVSRKGKEGYFYTTDEKATWWAMFHTFVIGGYDTQYAGFTIRWFGPDDAMFWEEEAGSLDRAFVKSSLPIKSSPASQMPGRWHVQAYYRGSLIDERMFYIIDQEQLAALGELPVPTASFAYTIPDHSKRSDIVVQKTLADNVEFPWNNLKPINPRTTFGTTDPHVTWGACFKTFSVTPSIGELFRARWFAPNGYLYWDQSFTPKYGNLCAETSMPVAGTFAQIYPGEWKMMVYYNGAVIDQNDFVIERS